MAATVKVCAIFGVALSLLPWSGARGQEPAQKTGVQASANKAMEAELDKRRSEINQAVDQVVEGKDVRTTLETLLQGFPEDYRDAVIARFRLRIEELNEEYARRRAEEERHRQAGVILDGELFNMVGTVLLMSTGSYESIEGVLHKKPDVAAQVEGLGSLLLGKGVTPDMQLVHRLRELYNRFLQEQKEREAKEKSHEAGTEEKHI